MEVPNAWWLAAPLQPPARKQPEILLAATRSGALRPLAADGAETNGANLDLGSGAYLGPPLPPRRLGVGPEPFGPFYEADTEATGLQGLTRPTSVCANHRTGGGHYVRIEWGFEPRNGATHRPPGMCRPVAGLAPLGAGDPGLGAVRPTRPGLASNALRAEKADGLSDTASPRRETVAPRFVCSLRTTNYQLRTSPLSPRSAAR